MTAKEYLRQYQNAEINAARLRSQYREEMATVDSIRSNIGDGMPHGGASSSPVETRAIRLAEIAYELTEAELDALEIRQTISRTINRVGGIKADILYERYIEFESWKRIADTVGYSIRHVHNLHREALEAVSRLIN